MKVPGQVLAFFCVYRAKAGYCLFLFLMMQKFYLIALMNSFGLFAGTTILNDGSFLIVLNVLESIKFVYDWMFLMLEFQLKPVLKPIVLIRVLKLNRSRKSWKLEERVHLRAIHRNMLDSH